MSQPNSRSSPVLPYQRRFDESWVELSSQPSSSSLSSIGDEIVTTGLQIRGPCQPKKRLQPSTRSLPPQHRPAEASSQDEEEEEESDSEDDRLLTSSTENVIASQRDTGNELAADSDEEDDATALGKASDAPTFRPHPNAFSHPPSGMGSRSYSSSAAIPPHPHSGVRRPSFPQRSQTRLSRGGPSFMSPSIREDNDEALRASLTTLLSCAAAARALPKTKDETAFQHGGRTGVTLSGQPMELCLVAEAELMDEGEKQENGSADTPLNTMTTTRSRSVTRAASEKPKRPSSSGRNPRAAKKKKMAVTQDEATLMSPTLLTWFVSAGVVVLVSVVGFGAGYVIGREVGRQEAQEAFAASVGGMNDTANCGQSVMRTGGSLRRFRWGPVGKSIVT